MGEKNRPSNTGVITQGNLMVAAPHEERKKKKESGSRKFSVWSFRKQDLGIWELVCLWYGGHVGV